MRAAYTVHLELDRPSNLPQEIIDAVTNAGGTILFNKVLPYKYLVEFYWNFQNGCFTEHSATQTFVSINSDLQPLDDGTFDAEMLNQLRLLFPSRTITGFKVIYKQD